ncbi:MAG: transposase, partial [Verrucomicrobiota bacterium]
LGAFVGDIKRFANPKKLVKYVGLNPAFDDSGVVFLLRTLCRLQSVWVFWGRSETDYTDGNQRPQHDKS